MSDWGPYLAYTVHPTRQMAEFGTDGRAIVERCEPEQAEQWTVYGRAWNSDANDGSLIDMAVADCPNEEVAERVADGLRLADSVELGR